MGRELLLFAAALALGAMIWVIPSPIVRYGMAFGLLWLLSGLAWASFISCAGDERPESLVVGLGLGVVSTCVTTLLASYLPGPVTRPLLLAAMVGSVSLPLVLSLGFQWKKSHLANGPAQARPLEIPDTVDEPSILNLQHRFWREGWSWLLIAASIAMGMRIANVGYAEFQGDEAAVLTRAARVLEGDEAAIFRHKKGPAEITSVVASWCLTGMTNEWMARLPFAWASILGVITVFLCGRWMERPHAGGIAACLLAVEGYLVGFGRIVQYQSLVFALSALGMLCLLVYHARGRGVFLVVAAVLFAGGLLAHYDAGLALPAGLMLVGGRLWRDRKRIGRALKPLAAAALVGLVLTSAFYVPFLRHPYFGSASSYLSGRLGGAQRFYDHLSSTFERSVVYDAVYLLALMALGLVVQMSIAWRRWGRVGLVLSMALIAVVLLGLSRPVWWRTDDSSLAWVPVALLMLGALMAPGQSMGSRAVWLWLGVPALFYLFFVVRPLTHIYAAFPAWAMASGLGLANLGRWLSKRSGLALRVAGVCGAAVYVVCGYYTAMTFVDHTPEYLRTFPQHEHPLYWTPYEEMPEEGLFGFPYRAGWKVVGYLMDAGALPGAYDSNEEQVITDWYTRRALRLDCASPDIYVIAADVQDEVPVRRDQIKTEYHPSIVVTVSGRRKLTVYEREASSSPSVYRAEDYQWVFDLGSTPARLASSALPQIRSTPPKGFISWEAHVGDFAKLLGYKVDTGHAVPGGYVELKLLWEALGTTPVDYKVFTHLYDGEMMRGQLDAQPVCGNHLTSEWRAGQFIVDPYRIPVEDYAPPGSVPLTIGMYNFGTMQRLPVSTPAGASAGDSVHLTDVMIEAP